MRGEPEQRVLVTRLEPMSEKRKVWEDMLAVMERLEMPISQKQRNYFLKA